MAPSLSMIRKISNVAFLTGMVMITATFSPIPSKAEEKAGQKIEKIINTQTLEEQIQSDLAALATENALESNPAEAAREHQEMVKNTHAALQQLKALIKEVGDMRGIEEFYRYGVAYPPAKRWKVKVDALSNRLESDDTVSPIVKSGVSALQLLPLEQEWRRGGMNDMAKWHLEGLKEALEWKPEE